MLKALKRLVTFAGNDDDLHSCLGIILVRGLKSSKHVADNRHMSMRRHEIRAAVEGRGGDS